MEVVELTPKIAAGMEVEVDFGLEEATPEVKETTFSEMNEEPAPEVNEEPAPEVNGEPAPEVNEEPAPEVNEDIVPEKLADDVVKLPLWKRLLYRFFPKLQKVEVERCIRAGDDEYNSKFKYAKNAVFTSRYNVITFVPKNLFEQFLRVANLYFLILLIIQLIPGVSSVPFYTTLIPLAGVLLVTAVKDAYDDIKRHVSDYKVNRRLAHVMGPDGQVSDCFWHKVKVGDILLLRKDDFITADILLLSSSEPNSLIYIETAELDGETNLKVRQPVPETAELGNNEEKLSSFNGEIICESPNNRLHKFVGRMDWNGQSYSLDNDKIVLRGCRLRNTKWMYGLVIYAGHDTKLVQNSGTTKFKRTHLDHFMNKAVLFILVFLLCCVLVCLIGSLLFEAIYGAKFVSYAAYYSSIQDNFAEIGFLQILSNIVVLNTFVPISLYVSVEVIRLGLSLLINWDLKMYYEALDVPAIARTTTLNEELGQIEYIFSDKTGTLTQNVMTFLRCSIRGHKYGEVICDDTEKEITVPTEEGTNKDTITLVVPKQLDFTSWNSYADEDFVYYDNNFLEKCRNGEEDCAEFWKLLSLCHTVLPSMETGKLQYNAQSPDEAALVSAARNFGYVFKARSPFTITMHNLSSNVEEEYDVLNILDFNNERKRMSIIVRKDGKITLYCKGADTIVSELLDASSKPLMKITSQHLMEYAREGLRTLILAKKDITIEEYTVWADEYHAASIVQKDRDEVIDLVYTKIEQNLSLIGATAIEDKLQDGVPETIANLAKADIKIWVLTGDKQETAINIGYSCRLLTEDMKIFIVDENTMQGVTRQLREANEEMDKMEVKQSSSNKPDTSLEDEETVMGDATGPPFGIVLNGHSLRYALREKVKLDLLETACKCKAVICCRVTPLQKKKVVDLVKKHKQAVTLAVGDGANDVGMIKAAHIGIGISGREGQQAVLASDYSYGQFRFLERLLLVHGRWSYHRMTTFLRYFFYKNFVFSFSQFIFAFFSGFTAQTLYDSTYIAIYNVVYTSLPILALAILDQDADENSCYRYPKLYIAGQKNFNFNNIIFVRSLVKGIYVALVVFFVLFGVTAFNVFPGGYEWDYQSFGLAASCALTIIVNLQIALDIFTWNLFMHLSVWLSILAWFIFIPLTGTKLFYSDFFQYGGVAFQVMATVNFWFYLPLAVVIALTPTIIFRLVKLYRQPSYIDFVRLKEKSEGKKLFQRKKMGRFVARMKSSYRSGYAFSHQEGFGRLISSGHIFGLNRERVEGEHQRRFSLMRSPSSQGVSEIMDATRNTNLEIPTKKDGYLGLSSENISSKPAHGSDTLNVPSSSITVVVKEEEKDVVKEAEKDVTMEEGKEIDVVDICNEAEISHKDDVSAMLTDSLHDDSEERLSSLLTGDLSRSTDDPSFNHGFEEILSSPV